MSSKVTRRRTQGAPGSEFAGQSQSEAKGRKALKQGESMVSNSTVLVIVVLCMAAGFTQHYYQRSRGRDPFGLYKNGKTPELPVETKYPRKPNTEKRSLLSKEDDEKLLRDEKNGNVRYHVIFSTDCSAYQHWQSYLVYYTAMRVKQTGTVTRIASGCDENQAKAMNDWFQSDISWMSSRFYLHLTPSFSGIRNEKGELVGDYKFFNKPFGLKYWMEHSELLKFNGGKFPDDVRDDVVILIDPDMGLLRPLTADFSNERETVVSDKRKEKGMLAPKVGQGKPFAQVYGFGSQWNRLDLEKIAGPNTPAALVSAEDARLYYPAGPPYLATVLDMYKIAVKWTEFVPAVYEQYPHLLAEMFAFCIAAAHERMPFQMIDSLMVSKTDAGGEGWPLVDQIPTEKMCGFAKHPNHEEHAVPSVVHLCQRYIVGKEWFFTKRKIPSDIYDCETPLFAEPPDDLAQQVNYKWAPEGSKTDMTPREAGRQSFMICYLYSLINEAATFYKQNACPADKINLEKTRNLVEYLAEQKGIELRNLHKRDANAKQY